MTDLLPCPFCGSRGIAHRVPTGWRVSCTSCDCQPRIGLPSDTEAAAISAWNMRAPPATQADALVKVGPITRIKGADSINCPGLPSGMMCFGWGEQGWAIDDKDGKQIASGKWGECVTLPIDTVADPLQSRVLTGDMAFPSGQSDALVEEIGHLLNEWQTGYDGHNPANLPTDDERYFVRASILPIIQRETAAAHAAGRAAEIARLREALRYIETVVYVDHQSGNANFEYLQSIARGALEGNHD